jgi:hypothetical protein
MVEDCILVMVRIRSPLIFGNHLPHIDKMNKTIYTLKPYGAFEDTLGDLLIFTSMFHLNYTGSILIC